MASVICQTCNKSNPDTLEICQFCGTPLKNRGTEPLPTIHPGEVPVKQKTSELESTLPGWLRDMRKGGDAQNTAPSTPPKPQPAKPTPQKQTSSPLDMLAGLSQMDDDDEEEPDWLASLKGTSSSEPAAPKAQAPVDWMAGLTGAASPVPNATVEPKGDDPVDWLAGFEIDPQPKTTQPEAPAAADWGLDSFRDDPAQPSSDWGGFNDLSDDTTTQSSMPVAEETPDWLSAIKAQDTNLNPPKRSKSEDFEDDDISSGNFPDWLNNLGGVPVSDTPTFDSYSFKDDSTTGISSLSDDESDLTGWLDGMTESAAPASSGPDTFTPAGESLDWLANLGGDTAPTPQKAPMQDASSDNASLDWLSNLGGDTPAASSMPLASQAASSETEFPDWIANLGGNAQKSPAQDAPLDGESLDWLSSFGGDATPAPENPQSAPNKPIAQDTSFDAETPDWLSNLGSEQKTPVQDTRSDGESLDWLSSFGGDVTPAPEKSQPAPSKPVAQDTSSDVETPDWLSNLGSEQKTPAQDTRSDGESLDWLSSFGGDVTPAPEKPQPAPSKPVAQDTSFGAETPDWLSNLGSEQKTPVQDTRSDGESLDWLSSFGGDATPVPEKPQPAPSKPVAQDTSFGAETPDWLSNLGDEQKTPVEDTRSDGESLDWLSSFGGDATPAPEKPQSAPSKPVAQDTSSEAEFPDWLGNLGGDTASEKSKPAMPVSSMDEKSSDAEFPDWLSNLGGGAAPEKSQPAPIGSQDSFADDWRSNLPGESKAVPVSATPSSSNESASIFANLLANDDIGWLEPPAQEKAAPAPEKPSTPAQKAFSTGSLEGLTPLKKTDDVPDWLANLNATTQKKAAEPVSSFELPNTDTLDWLSSANTAESKPAITESRPKGGAESVGEKPKAPVEQTPSAFLPDASQNLDSIFSMEMPDWLSGFTPAEPVAVPEQPGVSVANQQPVDDNLSAADLPSWVQAMRPIDSVTPGTQQSSADDQVVEQVGPLAGFRSVLPGSENAPVVRKPKIYSIKLQVDSIQLAQATLLENLIASEAESRPVVTAQRIVNFRSLRWTIAVVLLLVTLGAGVMSLGGRLFPLPSLPDSAQPEGANTEVRAFYDRVEGLSDAAKVLVVFDYQPGYAGEMEQAAGPVIAHLMQKNARMAFVSTLPTGILMNEHMMSEQNKTRSDSAKYAFGVAYVDLGYLPGDAAGIQVFAENPNVLGEDYQQNVNLWQQIDGIKDINNKLSNFDAAIVLTDNPDTGRMWIEQAGFALQSAEKPLLMVVSSQAAPMIFPYYASGQIKGLVSGLAGGVLYQTATGEPKTSTNLYWDAYGAGMIAAEFLIVIGAVWALIQQIRMRRAQQNNEEDEE